MIRVELEKFKLRDNKNKFCEKCSECHCDERTKYYKSILEENKTHKIYTCPYGYSSILTEHNLYTGLLIKGYSDLMKIKKRERYDQNYVQDYTIYVEEDIIEIIRKYEKTKFNYEIYKSTLHDIKRASSCAMEIVNAIKESNSDFSNDELIILIKDICDSVELINTRLDYHDRLVLSENNFFSAANNIKPCSIGKKISKLLDYKAKAKNIKIESCGLPVKQVKNDSKSIYVLFFVLIENAIKYSPVNSKIIIEYADLDNDKSFVKIKNQCENLEIDEVDKIFVKGFRGSNSEGIPGNGLGMEVVKKIFNMCKIEYKVDIEERDDKKFFSISFEIPSIE